MMTTERIPISNVRRRRSEGGSALIEFLLAAGLLIVPLLLGTIVFGLSLVRANQTTEVCRDAAHMYAYGVDFSQTASQNLIIQLAQGLNMTSTGGNGVIILSTLTYIDDTACKGGGYSDPTTCPNRGHTVFTNRIVIGNSGLKTSAFGTPNAGIIRSNGNIANTDYLKDSSANATGFSSLITLSSGQYAYMAETFVNSPDFNLWKTVGTGIISARSIF
jgi:Flp pilus assembly protein TadG